MYPFEAWWVCIFLLIRFLNLTSVPPTIHAWWLSKQPLPCALQLTINSVNINSYKFRINYKLFTYLKKINFGMLIHRYRNLFFHAANFQNSHKFVELVWQSFGKLITTLPKGVVEIKFLYLFRLTFTRFSKIVFSGDILLKCFHDGNHFMQLVLIFLVLFPMAPAWKILFIASYPNTRKWVSLNTVQGLHSSPCCTIGC